MRVFLAAVQAELRPEVYRTREAFAAEVERRVAEALAAAPAGVPRVVAFPELYALPLLYWLDAPEEAVSARTALAATWAWLRRLGARALRLGPYGFFVERAKAVWPVYRETFAEAARRHRAYLLAGTVLAPPLDEEPARGLRVLGLAPRNQGLLLGPSGRVLARPEKLRLMPEEKKALIRPGRWGGQVARTRIGTLATLVCLDAFHEALVERADAAGAWLLLQPSANPAPWDRPWPPDPRRREGEAWFAEGLAAKLADRENLRYGLNPMLTGRFYEVGFEGVANVAAPGEPIAKTQSPRGDAVASALVELEADAPG